MKKLIATILAVLFVISVLPFAPVEAAVQSVETGTMELRSDWKIAQKNGKNYIKIYVNLVDAVDLKNWNVVIDYDDDIFSYMSKSDGKDAKAVKNYCDPDKNSYTDETNADEGGKIYWGGYFKEVLWDTDTFLENSNFDGDCVVNSDNFEAAVIYLTIDDMDAFNVETIVITVSGRMKFGDVQKEIEYSLTRHGDVPPTDTPPEPPTDTPSELPTDTPIVPPVSDDDNVRLFTDWCVAEKNGMPYIAVTVNFINAVNLKNWNLAIDYDDDIFSYMTKSDGKDAKAVKNYCDPDKNSYTDETNADEGGKIYWGGYFKDVLWDAETFLENSNFDGDCVVNSDKFEAAVIYLTIDDMDAFEEQSTEITISGFMKFASDDGDVEKDIENAIEHKMVVNDKVALMTDWSIAERNGQKYIIVTVNFTNAINLKSWNFELSYDPVLFGYMGKSAGKDANAVKNYCNPDKNSYTDETNGAEAGKIYWGGYFKNVLWDADTFLENSSFDGDCVVNSDNFEALKVMLKIEDVEGFYSEPIAFELKGHMKFATANDEKKINIDYLLEKENTCLHTSTYTETDTVATCVKEGVVATICSDCGKILQKETTRTDPDNHTGETEIGNITVKPTEKMPGKGKVTCCDCRAVIGEEVEIPPINSKGYGMCGDGVHWVLKTDGELIIFGSGDIYDYIMQESEMDPDYNESSAPWVQEGFADVIESVTIEDGVTSIGDVAFAQCYYITSVEMADSVTDIGYGSFAVCEDLTDVDLSANLTTIGEEAFIYCTSLKNINIPASVRNIGMGAFGVTGLTEVTVPDSVTELAYYTFLQCPDLEKVTLPEGLVSIGYGAFGECESLNDISIPSTVTDIGILSFAYCSSLEEITLPDCAGNLGSGAFGYCESLKSVNIPTSAKEIPYSMFEGCASLEQVTIPDGVMAIRDGAFRGCSSLCDVTLPGSVEYIGMFAFDECTALEKLRIFNVNCIIDIGDNENGVTIPSSATIKIFADAQSAKEYAAYYGNNIEVQICSHDRGTQPIPTLESTCVANGRTGGKWCTICKKIMVQPEVLPLSDHNFYSYVIEEATHTKEGLQERYCMYCGLYEEQVIEKLPGHTYDPTVVAPTCTEDGYTLYECECGHTYTDNLKPQLGHVDENEDGKCERCGGKYEPPVVEISGDINKDGILSSIDARSCLRFAVDLDIPSAYQKMAADVDKNGKINSVDARKILRAAVGLEKLN